MRCWELSIGHRLNRRARPLAPGMRRCSRGPFSPAILPRGPHSDDNLCSVSVAPFVHPGESWARASMGRRTPDMRPAHRGCRPSTGYRPRHRAHKSQRTCDADQCSSDAPPQACVLRTPACRACDVLASTFARHRNAGQRGNAEFRRPVGGMTVLPWDGALIYDAVQETARDWGTGNRERGTAYFTLSRCGVSHGARSNHATCT
jgi:hypothetical protein